MQNNQSDIDEDEIDLKEVFRTIYNYRFMLISLVIIFTLGSAVFAYFKPNIYQASSIVEISADKKGGGGQEDILAMAMDGAGANVDTEIEILKSASLTQKALEKVDLTHRYYTKRKLKTIELYKNSPFKVGLNRGYGVKFELKPLENNKYELIVDSAKDQNGNEWSYEAIHTFGEEVVNEHFHLNVIKSGEFKDESYTFVVNEVEKTARALKENISVSQTSKKASVVSITVTDNVAVRAKELANALAEAYVKQTVDKKVREADLKLKFIEKQLKSITQNLEGSAIKLEEFKKSANTIDLGAKAQVITEQMSQNEIALSQIDITQKMLESLYAQIKSGKSLDTISIEGVGMEQSSLSTVIKELQDAILKKRILREDYTEVYPEVAKLTRTIDQLKRTIVAKIKSLNSNIKEKKKLLESTIEKQQAQLNKLPANERRYSDLQRRYLVNEKIYSYLLEKQSETQILKASTVSQNMIIDHAFVPEKPVKPKRKLIVLVGMILGLIVGIALAFLRAFLDDRIKSEEDIEKETAVPIFGTIPYIKKDADKLKVFISPKSVVSEAYRNLRTNLQFMSKQENASVIAVTSTVGAEGKTTVATNLSGIMSMSGKRVIILNLDMRKPTLHSRFEIPQGKGMSALLSNLAELDDVIQESKHENLHVITSGAVPPNPSELIQSEKMKEVLKELKKRYDVIILDTPPVGLVTDARVLMHLADITLYVTRAEYSKKNYMQKLNSLSEEDISGLGVVLNAVNMEGASYGYGYGYGYGYYEEDHK